MRNFFLVLLTSAVGFVLLASPSQAQKFEDKKKPDDPEKVLADLLRAVKNKDDANARIEAMVGLQEFGPKAEAAVPDLLDALETKNEDLRINAAITLGKIGKAAVKPVAELLTSKDDDTKFYAIWTIGWIGPDAKEAVPALRALATDPNKQVREVAAGAVRKVQAASASTSGS